MFNPRIITFYNPRVKHFAKERIFLRRAKQKGPDKWLRGDYWLWKIAEKLRLHPHSESQNLLSFYFTPRDKCDFVFNPRMIEIYSPRLRT